jgi:hypothetical protein
MRRSDETMVMAVLAIVLESLYATYPGLCRERRTVLVTESQVEDLLRNRRPFPFRIVRQNLPFPDSDSELMTPFDRTWQFTYTGQPLRPEKSEFMSLEQLRRILKEVEQKIKEASCGADPNDRAFNFGNDGKE